MGFSFSVGDAALIISVTWVLLAGCVLLITYLIKEYSTASHRVERLFNFSWIILIPGGILLTILAHVMNQIKKADGAEENYYNALDYYAPLLKFFDRYISLILIASIVIAIFINAKQATKKH